MIPMHRPGHKTIPAAAAGAGSPGRGLHPLHRNSIVEYLILAPTLQHNRLPPCRGLRGAGRRAGAAAIIHMRNTSLCFLVLSFFLATACGDDGGGGGDDILPADATFTASGTVYDLETDEPLESPVSITAAGLERTPTVSVTDADFTVEVPANSAFHLLAGSFPDYRPTYNVAIEVAEEDVTDLRLYVIREGLLEDLAAGFGVTPADDTGLVMMRVEDAEGNPLAGVTADAFALPQGVLGPFFLDADLAADVDATQTSTSGLVLFYDLEPGLLTLEPAPGAEFALAAPIAPIDDSIVTFVRATAGGDPIVIPQNVSFINDVAPIFIDRGCVACHLGGGVGKDLGGLHLNGEANKMHKELTDEISQTHGVTRVDLQNPAASLLLTMPSFEDPPDVHPFATFTGNTDADYLTILAWIQEGALNN